MTIYLKDIVTVLPILLHFGLFPNKNHSQNNVYFKLKLVLNACKCIL